MPVSEHTFLQVALEEPNQWELHCGQLVRKPAMSAEHNHVEMELTRQLLQQLPKMDFEVRSGMGHLRRTSESYYIPDVFVVSTRDVRKLRGRSDTLEAYGNPLPLVV